MFFKKKSISLPEATERAVIAAGADYQEIINIVCDKAVIQKLGKISNMKAEPAWSELLKGQCAMQLIIYWQINPEQIKACKTEFWSTLETQLAYNPDNAITAYLKKEVQRKAWRSEVDRYMNIAVEEIASRVAKKIQNKLPHKLEAHQTDLLEILLKRRYEGTYKGLLSVKYDAY